MRFTHDYKKRKRSHLFISINITPLTDIALVLLVIFMIATPMLIQSKIKINLPKVEAEKRIAPSRNLIIFINKRGKIFLNDSEIKFSELRVFLKDFILREGDKSVTLNGDKDVKYDVVIQVLNLLKENGLKNIALGIEVK